VFRQDESSGLAHIERSADKWARDPTGKEWHEKWWERYNAKVGRVAGSTGHACRVIRQIVNSVS